MADTPDRIRLDKWLWQARFFKTRSKASEAVTSGLRVNTERCTKPAQNVKPGDVLTFSQGRQVRVIQIDAIGTRRGPAVEAQALYTDLAPPAPPEGPSHDESPRPAPTAQREPGSGRPTKRERREIDALGRSRS